MMRLGLTELGWLYYLPMLILALGFTALVAYKLGYVHGHDTGWHQGWNDGWNALEIIFDKRNKSKRKD